MSGAASTEGGGTGAGAETVCVDLPTVRRLHAALAAIGDLQGAERWDEMSAALVTLGRHLGALLPFERPSADSGPEERQVHLNLEDQALMALPWELAIGGEGRDADFLFAPGALDLVRQEPSLPPPQRQAAARPSRVTVLAEKPIHFGLSDLSASVAAIEATFERCRRDAQGGERSLEIGDLRREPAPNRSTQILHLLGHGYETSGIDARFEYGMHCASLRDSLPEDAYGEAPAERIARELARHAPFEALLLDACYTGGGFRWDGERWRDPLGTLAARLGGALVISYFDAMKIVPARTFAGHFFERVFAGEAPLAAAAGARQALFRAEVGKPLRECAWWKVRIGTGAGVRIAA